MRAGKNNFAEVTIYGLVLAALLLWRIQQYLKGGFKYEVQRFRNGLGQE
jgi:DMSO/TMAO reductase YedYZ heme-binding membrane subunit